jgi:small subunit ribosomal protein S8
MFTDPIADMLTRIRNASMARKPEVRLPYSNLKYAIGKILAQEGYVDSVERADGTKPEMRITLKYVGREPMVRSIVRVSTPGHRVYSPHEMLPRVLSDQGIAIVSTSQGVMTNKEARKRRLGGEVLCKVF